MKINIKRIRQTIAICALLFYPFNNSISNYILFGSLNPFILVAIGLIFLLPDLKKKIPKALLLSSLIEIVIILVVLLDNKLSGRYGYTLIQLSYLAIMPILVSIDIDKKAASAALTIFTVEHIAGTLYPMILPEIYKNNFLPFICNANSIRCSAKIAFQTGMNAGITGQSSTNGCYMAIFSIFHTSSYLSQKNKHNGALAILSIVCLLIIGKRASLLFTILALIAIYITKNNNFKPVEFFKKNLKIIIICIISLISITAISSSIPQIRTTIDRVIESSSSDDITSNRIPLYKLAIEKWREKPIFGNGWGYYSVASHETFGEKTYGVDYMHAHNDYLEILCDKGVFGLVIYSALLFWIIKRAYSIRNNGYFEKFAFAYIIFFVLYSITGTPLYNISNFIALLLTIIISEKKNEKNRSNNI